MALLLMTLCFKINYLSRETLKVRMRYDQNNGVIVVNPSKTADLPRALIDELFIFMYDIIGP